AWFVAEAGALALLAQRFPQYVSKKANQDVGLHAVFFLVPDGPHDQIALVETKRFFGFCELDIGAPELFSAPVGHVATEQITSLAQLHPIAALIAFAPAQMSPTLRVGFHIHLEQACGPAVLPQQPAHLLSYSERILFALAASFRH